MNKVITNLKVYDLEETLVASGYAMIEDYSEDKVYDEQIKIAMSQVDGDYIENPHVKRAFKLAKAPFVPYITGFNPVLASTF